MRENFTAHMTLLKTTIYLDNGQHTRVLLNVRKKRKVPPEPHGPIGWR